MNRLNLYTRQGDTISPPIDMEVTGCCEICEEEEVRRVKNAGNVHRQINNTMPAELIINLLEKLIPGAMEFFNSDDRIVDPLEATPETYLNI